MATATTEVCQEKVYALIGNIPPEYHSSDLRNFFSHCIESDGFDCFHFRHRPEGQNDANDGDSSAEKRKQNETSKPKLDRSNTQSLNKTCCIVKMKLAKFQELRQLYHKKHWVTRKGETIPSLCFISKINLAEERGSNSVHYPNHSDSNNTEAREKSSVRSLGQEELDDLMELKPPGIMPNGNVGTPTKVFLDLIRSCTLPPKVIRKLGLTFPKSHSRRIYSSVKFDYDGLRKRFGSGARSTSMLKQQRNILHRENLHDASTGDGDRPGDGHGQKRTEPGPEDDKQPESESEEDADDCEEWERHESLHDDPANYERNKERVYEEKLEVVWEKGGPGLVWYTDEKYWREQEGDFDEQTADDWDVDMSVYYDPLTGGDMDSRQLVTMRREARRRQGLDIQEDLFIGTRIGKFEKHTKGIGRKVLEKQGWTEGAGVGSSKEGMTEALDNDGQHPRDKTGFGYHGEKIQQYGSGKGRRKRQDPDDFMISTVYDNPEDMEIPEKLLRRTDHNTMKYTCRPNTFK